METIRLFVALPLPEPARTDLASGVRNMTEPALRPLEPGNLHITVLFLGEVPRDRLTTAGAALHTGVENANVGRLRLQIGSPALFPSARRPHAVAAAVGDPSGGLFRLHAAVADAFAQTGMAGDTRRYRPHITLAYLKRGALPRVPQNERDTSVEIGEIVLFESRLQPGGAVHTRRATESL